MYLSLFHGDGDTTIDAMDTGAAPTPPPVRTAAEEEGEDAVVCGSPAAVRAPLSPHPVNV
jgi:hypothetical protein